MLEHTDTGRKHLPQLPTTKMKPTNRREMSDAEFERCRKTIERDWMFGMSGEMISDCTRKERAQMYRTNWDWVPNPGEDALSPAQTRLET